MGASEVASASSRIRDQRKRDSRRTQRSDRPCNIVVASPGRQTGEGTGRGASDRRQHCREWWGSAATLASTLAKPFSTAACIGYIWQCQPRVVKILRVAATQSSFPGETHSLAACRSADSRVCRVPIWCESSGFVFGKFRVMGRYV